MNQKYYIKISFIIVIRNREAYEECLKSLTELHIPDYVTADVISITEADSLAAGYNQGMNSSDAEYRVYLKDTVRIVNQNFIVDFLKIFAGNDKLGILGVTGAGEIIDDAKRAIFETLEIDEYDGDYKIAACLRGDVYITARDFTWREDLFTTDELSCAAQSLEYRKRGFNCAVITQAGAWLELSQKNTAEKIPASEQRQFIEEYKSYILARKTYDEHQFAIICHEPDKHRYKAFCQQVKQLDLAEPYTIQIIRVGKVQNLAQAYNEAMRSSGARYKIYLNGIAAVNIGELLDGIIKTFLRRKDIGLLGSLGGYLPLSGYMSESKKIFGRFAWARGEEADEKIYEKPLFYQEVNYLEPSFLASQIDVFWDEAVADCFIGTAACCRMAEHGFKSVVIEQDKPWILFAHENVMPQKEDETVCQHFLREYGRRIFPLVSILIPTFQAPVYFEQALKSALQQDYPNIEIVVGDDSSDERTKQLIQPYLAKYEHMRYYFHGEPLGNHGRENMGFLINHCAGEYVNCLQHDDLNYPTKISRMMEYFLSDENIHMATSVRDAIDADGHIMGVKSPWIPEHDRILSSFEVGEKILHHMNNFIGEPSTVLLKKSLLRYKDGYMIGSYCGIRDRVYFDLSTYLEIGLKGGKVVFLSEHLSAFRQHPNQNTGQLEMQIQFVLDFLGFIVLSWLNHAYIRTKEQYRILCDKWYICFVANLNMRIKEASIEVIEGIKNEGYFLAFLRLRDYVKNKQYNEVLHETVKYIVSHTDHPQALMNVYQQDENVKA